MLIPKKIKLRCTILGDKDLVYIFSDGSSLGNPGPGGYGVLLRFKKYEKEIKKGYILTTNNRMELLGAITGLELLKKSYKVILITDSRYIVDGINLGWARKWQLNSWMKNKKDKAKNIDLWERLLKQTNRHDVTFQWTAGHSGHEENERCDQLATSAANGSNLVEDIGFEK